MGTFITCTLHREKWSIYSTKNKGPRISISQHKHQWWVASNQLQTACFKHSRLTMVYDWVRKLELLGQDNMLYRMVQKTTASWVYPISRKLLQDDQVRLIKSYHRPYLFNNLLAIIPQWVVDSVAKFRHNLANKIRKVLILHNTIKLYNGQRMNKKEKLQKVSLVP